MCVNLVINFNHVKEFFFNNSRCLQKNSFNPKIPNPTPLFVILLTTICLQNLFRFQKTQNKKALLKNFGDKDTT